MSALSESWHRPLRSWLDAAHRHPRRLALAALTMLGGFAATAFGIAPLAGTAASVPVRQLTQDLPLPGLDLQLAALADQPLLLAHSTVSRASDTADSLLRRLGVDDPLALAFVRSDREARRLLDGSEGRLLQARTDSQGTLLQLVARFPALEPGLQSTHFSRLTVERIDGQLVSRLETAPLTRQAKLGNGTVSSGSAGSLWTAVDEAGLPDTIAAQMIDIFSGEIDFHRKLRPGAAFRVIYEALTADDQPITWQDGTGRILAAEFSNNGRTLQALWYDGDADGSGRYLDFQGRSLKRSFLASPLPFSRITSGFAMRLHPVFNTWRAHNGVDYAAPTGTPVRVVADGVVTFAGRQSGYGNVVEIKHDSRQSTVYAHLHQFDVAVGQRLAQGQVLGQVGSTGWATGPHLHFEYRVNGQFQDPENIVDASSSGGAPVDRAERRQFSQTALLAREQLRVAASLSRFHGDAE